MTPRRSSPLLTRRGAAALEFAVIAPLLALIAFGGYDLGNAAQTSIRLERAARAGAQYAVANPGDLAGIRTATIAAWPQLTASDVSLPVEACSCGGVPAACTSTCAAGLVRTLTITARKDITGVVLPGTQARTGSAVVRVR